MLSLQLPAAVIVSFVLVVPFAGADPAAVSVEDDTEADWVAVSVFGDASGHGHAASVFGNASSDCSYSGQTLCAPVSGGCYLEGSCLDDPDGSTTDVTTDGDAEGFVAIALHGDAEGTIAIAPQGDARGTGAIAGGNASGNSINTVAIAVFGDARGTVATSIMGDAYGPYAASGHGNAGPRCYSGGYCESAPVSISLLGEADGTTEIEGNDGSFFADTPECSITTQVFSWLGTCHAGRFSISRDKATEGAWAISVFGDAHGSGCAIWGNLDEPLYHLFTTAPGCQVRSVAVSVFGHADGEAASVSGCDLAGLCYDELP